MNNKIPPYLLVLPENQRDERDMSAAEMKGGSRSGWVRKFLMFT